MHASPKIGSLGEVRFLVEAAHTIDFPGVPRVLSTPSLVWFLEMAAIEALKPVMAPGETSLGTEIEVQHLAPTPLGEPVHCLARLATVDGNKVAFHVEAHDDHELIAKGFHRRVIVSAERFSRAVAKKMEGA